MRSQLIFYCTCITGYLHNIKGLKLQNTTVLYTYDSRIGAFEIQVQCYSIHIGIDTLVHKRPPYTAYSNAKEKKKMTMKVKTMGG